MEWTELFWKFFWADYLVLRRNIFTFLTAGILCDWKYTLADKSIIKQNVIQLKNSVFLLFEMKCSVHTEWRS